MRVNGTFNQQQFKEMQQALNALELPPKKRQRFLWRMAKYGVIVAAKRHVRQQQTPDGEAWTARRSNWRKKMLRNLPKHLHIKEMPEIEAVRVYLSGGHYHNGGKSVPAGVVGYAQQEGMRVKVTKPTPSKTAAKTTAPATPKQAKQLRKLGYKVRKGTRWRKPSLKEIRETLKFTQAGLLIRKLKGRPPKNSWVIDVPARAFLGLSDDEFAKALARQLQAIGFGTDVKAQDIRR